MMAALALLSAVGTAAAQAPSDARAEAQADVASEVALGLAAKPSAAFLRSVTPAVDEMYVSRPGQTIWSPAAAKSLLATLKGTDRHAIDAGPLLALIGKPGPPRARDRALTRAALAYAKALSSGLTNPDRVFAIFTLRRNQTDIVAGLRAALAGDDVGPWLESLAPQDAEYAALARAYFAAVSQADKPTPPPIASGPLIQLGDADARIAAIMARLTAEGVLQAPADIAPGAPQSPVATWTHALSEALAAYQSEHGLAADGIVGPTTLKLLNETPADRARRLAVNLERRRWLERDPPAERIDVNIASAMLVYLRDSQPDWSAKVIVGRPRSPTPMLQASFERIVVNPPWVVPTSIARREIEPKGPAYLRRHHMRWRGGHIVQAPGPWAALGLVKFDVRDPYAIYLHDTPERSLFHRSQRHLSHGCVRIDGAVEFARRLAEESGKGAEFEAELKGGKTRSIHLGRDLTVRLYYHTAFVDGAGQVAFRPDVYGWDARLASALGMTPTPDENVERSGPGSLGP